MLKQPMKAFTLLEVLIVAAIIGIISGVSWATLGTAKKGADAGNACTQVASYINKARNYTVSGKDTLVTVTINGSDVNIVGTKIAGEGYVLKGGVDCGFYRVKYSAPNGDGGTTAGINCTSGGITRTVNVTPYQAVCVSR